MIKKRGNERYKLKLNLDNLDEMRKEDKEVMKHWGYDRCDIYLWQGNLCISYDYARHLINTIKGKIKLPFLSLMTPFFLIFFHLSSLP